MDSSP